MILCIRSVWDGGIEDTDDDRISNKYNYAICIFFTKVFYLLGTCGIQDTEALPSG